MTGAQLDAWATTYVAPTPETESLPVTPMLLDRLHLALWQRWQHDGIVPFPGSSSDWPVTALRDFRIIAFAVAKAKRHHETQETAWASLQQEHARFAQQFRRSR